MASSKLTQLKANQKKYFDEHIKTKTYFKYIVGITLNLISAFLFAVSFKMFQSPDVANAIPLVSGGSGGIARTFGLIFQMAGVTNNFTLVYSVAYVIINIPVLYIAFRFIGIRFGIFTAVNIIATSLLTNFLDLSSLNNLAKGIACVINEEGVYVQAGLLPRAILAGVFSGVGSSISFTSGGSSGGTDTVGYYFSMRKSTNIGRYSIIINSFIFVLFASLNSIDEVVNQGIAASVAISNCFLVLLFLAIYTFVGALVVDSITRQNKKEQIQIVTKEPELVKIILETVHHSATIVKAKGAFTGEDRIIIYATVSIYETKKLVELVRSADPNCFVNVASIKSVYGNFVVTKNN